MLYPLRNNLGLTVFSDAMPAPTPVAPALGYCIEFDGLGMYGLTSGIDFTHGDYTIEFWLKDFGSQINPVNNANFILHNFFVRISILNNNSFNWTAMNYPVFNDFSVPYSSVPGINPSAWTHCAFRFTAAGFKRDIFINGNLIATNHSMNALGSGPYYIFTIGGYFNGGATSFAFYKGKMDEFRLYTRALSNGEINYSYGGGMGTLPQSTTGLALWYAFEKNASNLGYTGSQYSLQMMNVAGSAYKQRNSL